MAFLLRIPLIPVMLLMLSGAAVADPPGAITFSGRNMVATAEGTFSGWRLTKVEVDREHPDEGIVEVEVDVTSIDTGNARRDDHLRNEDFFDVDRFPTARVKLYGASPRGKSANGHPRYGVMLDVSIRDIEKTLSAEFELVSEAPPTVEGTVAINRMDFGVGGAYRRWNPLSVREDVQVRFRAVLPGEFDQ